MSILYQNSDLTQSKVYYSYTKHQFCMNLVLLSSRSLSHLGKNSKHCKKLMRYFSISTYSNSSNFELKQTKNLLQ